MPNSKLTLIHQALELSAAGEPRKEALADGELRVSYRQVDHAVNSLACWLRACGVDRGDRVVIMVEGGFEFVVSFFGVLKAGAVAVPLGAEHRDDSLRSILAAAEPRGLIVGRDRAGGLTAIDPGGLGVRALLVDAESPQPRLGECRVFTWGEVVATAPCIAPDVKIGADDLASITYTDAASGRPKGVMHTHRNLVADCSALVRALHLCGDDVQLIVPPISCDPGVALAYATFAVGGRLVIANRISFSSDGLRQLAREGVTGLLCATRDYDRLLSMMDLTECRERLRTLRHCLHTDGTLSPSLRQRLLQFLPEQTSVFTLYGAAAAAHLLFAEALRQREAAASIGRQLPGVSMKVIGEDGNELPDGEVGELVASGRSVSPGFWRDRDATRRVLSGQGYRTGEYGYRDADGNFYLAEGDAPGVKTGSVSLEVKNLGGKFGRNGRREPASRQLR